MREAHRGVQQCAEQAAVHDPQRVVERLVRRAGHQHLALADTRTRIPSRLAIGGGGSRPPAIASANSRPDIPAATAAVASGSCHVMVRDWGCPKVSLAVIAE